MSALEKKSIQISQHILEAAFISPLDISRPAIKLKVEAKQTFVEDESDDDINAIMKKLHNRTVKHNKKTRVICGN